MNPYLLADDLSGALEAGVTFRAVGWRVGVALDQRGGGDRTALNVVSTETRNVSAEVAAAAVGNMLAMRRTAGERLLFKKIDSTLRGPVGAELRVMLEVLVPPLVVFCPATPAAGRTVREGILRVAGVPVGETAFRDDPVCPVTESRVVSHLRRGGVERIACVSLDALRSGAWTAAAARARVLVCDAETDDDLRRLVMMARTAEPGAIFVGAGGLARALAADMGAGPTAPSVERPKPRSVLLVSGSRNPRSLRQLERLGRDGRVPLHGVDRSAESQRDLAGKIAGGLKDQGAVALTISSDAGRVDPGEPIAWLTATVGALIRRGAVPPMLMATGGETAQALCLLLGVQRLELLEELEPGVVLAAVGGSRVAPLQWMIIKPGGFGSDDVWCSILRSLGV